MKVWVTYDPLVEKTICVHEKEDMTCLLCDAIREERANRQDAARFYHLRSEEFEIQKEKIEDKFIVRFYDKFDGWIDISGDLSKEEADEMWKLRTDNGTQNTKYEDNQYYCIFPADTKMYWTPEKLERNEDKEEDSE